MLPRTSGIYQIICHVTGKVYVGSAVNIYRRWLAYHLPDLRGGRHANKHLQRAWNKYGEAAFTCEVLLLVEAKEQLIDNEQQWIEQLRSSQSRYGFNICKVAGSSLGRKHTSQTRRLLSRQHSKDWVVRSPDGRETRIRNLYGFCVQHGLTLQAMSAVAAGRVTQHRGWECRHAGVSRTAWLQRLQAVRRPIIVNVDEKYCPSCNKWLPFSAFTRDSGTIHGYSAYCRDCNKNRHRKAYLKDRPKRLAAAKTYRQANAARRKVAQAKNYQEHREERIAYARERRAAHRSEKLKESV